MLYYCIWNESHISLSSLQYSLPWFQGLARAKNISINSTEVIGDNYLSDVETMERTIIKTKDFTRGTECVSFVRYFSHLSS